MFIAENDNTQEVTDLLSSEQDKILAVAFIGNGLSKVIRGKNKIICNLTSGATNPSEIRTLMKSENIKIRNNSNLHAKVYFTQNKLIVGSSNISTNGIALEKDCANWIEASIITSEKSSLKSSNIWLSELWNTSEEITPKMLNKAEALFKKRRNSRPFKKGSICDLRDRDIYCTIYKNEELSTEANEYANKLLGDNWDENGYGIYESWKKLPKGVLLDFHHSGEKLNSLAYINLMVMLQNQEVLIFKLLRSIKKEVYT